MHIARSLLSPGVCPFVTCIVSEVYCIMAEDIGKLLSGPGSPTILLFDPSAGTQFHQRGRKIHLVRKICDFRLKSPFISETV